MTIKEGVDEMDDYFEGYSKFKRRNLGIEDDTEDDCECDCSCDEEFSDEDLEK